MRVVSTAALLDAWEDGMGESMVDRAPSLLRALGLDDSHDPAAMTVGTCDLLLLELRQSLFGPDLDMMATCPGCRESVELVVPIEVIKPARPASAAGQVTVETSRLLIRCRVPTNSDLRVVAARGADATVADLLERCVDSIAGPGAPQSVAELPPSVMDELAAVLAASDPGAEITAEIACPCGAQWTEIVDIRSILWTELTRWARLRLAEVHRLASAYGWAERAILEMSPHRRRFYLEACA